LTFASPSDYNKIREDDLFNLTGLDTFLPGKPLRLELHHSDGSAEEIAINHSYSDQQIRWFNAGSALNYMQTLK